MKVTDGIKSLFNKIRNRWMALATVAVMGTNAVSCSSGSNEKNENKKVNKQEQVVKVKSPVKQIKYITDTLFQTGGRALLYYKNGKITRNFMDGNNIYKMDLPLFSHEDWHAHNDKINLRLTPFKYYISRIHNEISANIVGLLTARYQYMVTKDKKAFARKYKGKMFGFYFDAVAKGKIKPESNDPKKLEREYKFIVNGMQKAWMEKNYRWYMPSFYGMLQRYVERNGLVDGSDKSYDLALRHMYTIGGVDFSKYFKQDVVPSDGRVMIVDGLRNITSMRDGGVDVMNYINDGYALFDNIGIEKQTEAIQHLLISAKLKYALRKRTIEELQQNPQMIDMYYRQIISKIQKDKIFEDFVNNYPVINEKSCAVRVTDKHEYRDIISKLYTFNGIDLSKNIQDFRIEKVPVKNPDFNGFDFTDNNYYWGAVSAIYGEIPQNKYSGPIITDVVVNKSQPRIKSRRSGWQYIYVPNYREPILLSPNKEDKASILKAIKDFEDIPQVLKECDTEAQKKYYDSLEKTKEKQNKMRQKETLPVRRTYRQRAR